MASNDVAVTKADIEGLKFYIDGKIVELKGELESKAGELKSEMIILEHKIELNATKIDMLQHYQTLGFTLMGAIIGLAAIILTAGPSFMEIFKERRREKRDDEIITLVRNELAKFKGNIDGVIRERV